MNRLATHIERLRAKFETLPEQDVIQADAQFTIDAEEHFVYQNAQANCHAAGIINTEEAQLIYLALGEFQQTGNGGWTKDTDTATKVGVSIAMVALLAKSTEMMLAGRL